ncbi:MAG: non-ribosomal peptide synthetase, partial [Gemmatimonadetes bacterium]|nr:non-ribosomal peptide synthetase [Gemmatimonadota bacterium]
MQAPATLSPIEPVDRSGTLPLSFAQQRLWFVEQLENTGAAYHIPTHLPLRGELDRDALGRALDRIVARHEALRTVFPVVDGEPAQRIIPAEESRFHLVEHDLSGSAAPGMELRRVMAEEAGALFDLERGPLIRGRLIRWREDDHLLLVTMHHIVSDGWSMGVFTRELGALYDAFLRGASDPLPPLPVQYADYAAWQRELLGDESDPDSVVARQLAFWSAGLADLPGQLELPTDRPFPPVADGAGDVVE